MEKNSFSRWQSRFHSPGTEKLGVLVNECTCTTQSMFISQENVIPSCHGMPWEFYYFLFTYKTLVISQSWERKDYIPFLWLWSFEDNTFLHLWTFFSKSNTFLHIFKVFFQTYSFFYRALFYKNSTLLEDSVPCIRKFSEW